MFSGTDRQWFITGISLMTSFIGLLMGIILMAKTNLGLYGMAIGWAAVFIIRGVLILPLSACRHFRMKLISYIEQAYLPPLIPATILMLSAYMLKEIFEATSIASLAFCIALCIGVYAIAVYSFCLDVRQKLQVRSIVNRLRA